MKRVLPLFLLVAACGSGPTEPLKASNDLVLTPVNPITGEPTKSAVVEAQASAEERTRERERERAEREREAEERRRRDAEEPSVSADGLDPAKGHFTLAEATAGLAGSGPLLATIATSKGDLQCTLYEQKAPNTVANFVGLARGTRPWKTPQGRWVKRPAYDGTIFHRVIKGFMIQGGDPQGTGTGEPGYVIPDEVWPGAVHDRAGLLCMANRGPNTNGAQFFVTDAPARHLDKSYTIFGDCHPTSTVRAIASVPRNEADRPDEDIVIKRVTISHESKGGDAASKAEPAPKAEPAAREPAPAPPSRPAPPAPTSEPPRF